MTPRRHHRLRPHAGRRVGAPRRHRRVPRARLPVGAARARARAATTASVCTCTSTSARRRSSRSASRARPVARRSLLCTSGTAAANFHPAVLEAHHGRVPLIVCTADRPPELRDTGAGQTIDQVKLYGDAVRWFHEAETCPSDRRRCRRRRGAALASRAVADATRAAGGTGAPRTCRSASRSCRRASELVDAPGRSDDRPWTAHRARGAAHRRSRCSTRSRTSSADRPRGLVVAGWGAGVRPATVLRFAEAAGWPVLADPLSNLRVPGTDRARTTRCCASPASPTATAPDVVLRVGAPHHQQAARSSGSTRRSTRCWSIPTTRGSTPRTARAVAWSPTPSCSSARSPTRST